MKLIRHFLFCILCCSILVPGAQAQWVNAYYLGTWGDSLPPSRIYFPAITNIMHHSLEPTLTGGIYYTGPGSNEVGLQHSRDILEEGHKNGKKVLLVIGGGVKDAGVHFYNIARSADSTILNDFVTRVMTFMKRYGYETEQKEQYDGIDIDWEFLWMLVDTPYNFSKESVAGAYKNLVHALRAALDDPNRWPAGTERKMLTLAVQATHDPVFLQMYDDLRASGAVDQFNIMTYDLAGPYEDKMLVYHNSAVYTTDSVRHHKLSSADATVRWFLTKDGFARRPGTIGIGSPFSGILWSGVERLYEPAPVPGTSQIAVSYTTIMRAPDRGGYYDTSRYRWVDDSKGAIIERLPNRQFISFDNQRSIVAKFDYLRANQLGGIILWDICAAYRTDLEPPELPDSLLRTVDAMKTPVSQNMITLRPGWNMVSVPLFLPDNSAAAVFGQYAGAAYEWKNDDSALTGPVHTVRSGVGYWIRYRGEQPVRMAMTGGGLTRVVVPVKRGWNMIGTVTSPLLAVSLMTQAANGSADLPRITSEVFRQHPDGRQETVRELIPGEAYWVQVDAPGYIIVDSESDKERFSRPPEQANSSPPGETQAPASGVPGQFRLHQNFPNPFNPTTTIRFDLPRDAHVSLAVYNTLGMSVRTVIDGEMSAGYHEAVVEMTGLASGIYFVRIQASENGRENAVSFDAVRKLILLK